MNIFIISLKDQIIKQTNNNFLDYCNYVLYDYYQLISMLEL